MTDRIVQTVMPLPRHHRQKISITSRVHDHPPASFFTNHTLDQRIHEIQQLYRNLQRPWVVMVSLGKDSKASLQLIWTALTQLPERERTYPVFVICGDTFAEIPVFQAQITNQIHAMNQAAHDACLPISAHISQPLLRDRLWVCVLGYGYAMPTARFRWCTDRLKIKPNRALARSIAGTDRIVCVIGVRSDESSQRSHSIQKYRITGLLSHNRALSNALTCTPIHDWLEGDVWSYLLTTPPPWSGHNRDLLALYRSGSATGECPVVMHQGSASCGTGRFGCWCCTVAHRNNSLASLVDDPTYAWMDPLYDLYARLKDSTDPANKLLYREPHSMNHTQSKRRADGSAIPGRLKWSFRETILRELLLVQAHLRREGPYCDLTLIQPDELRAIRALWYQAGYGDRFDLLVHGIVSNAEDDLHLLEKPRPIQDARQLILF